MTMFKMSTKTKIIVSALSAFILVLSSSYFYDKISFSFLYEVISFVVFYVLLWGYDNPEERDTYK